MAQYHVGCGLAGIYAGTLKKSGDEWLNKSLVTNEAVNAVVQYMYFNIPEGADSFAYAFRMRNGRYVRLSVEACDQCPDWAEGLFQNEGDTDD